MNNTIRIFLLLMVVVLGIGFAIDRMQKNLDPIQKENKVSEKGNEKIDEDFNNMFKERENEIKEIPENIKTKEIIKENTQEKKIITIKKEDKKIKIYSNQWNFSKIEFLNGTDVVAEINNNNYIKNVPDSQQGQLIYYTTILSKNKKYVAVAKKTRILNSGDFGSSLDVKIYDINGKYLWGGKNRDISILSNNGLFFFDTGNGVDGMEYVYVTRKIGKDIKIQGTFYGLEKEIIHYSNGGVMFRTGQRDLVTDEIYDITENTLGRTGNLVKGKIYGLGEVKGNKIVISRNDQKKYYRNGKEVSKRIDDYFKNYESFAKLPVYINGNVLKKNYVNDQKNIVPNILYVEHSEEISLSWTAPWAEWCGLWGSNMPLKDGRNINSVNGFKNSDNVKILIKTFDGEDRETYSLGLTCSAPGIEENGIGYEYNQSWLIPIFIK